MQRVSPIVYRNKATELVPYIVVILIPDTVKTVKNGRTFNDKDLVETVRQHLEAMGIYASKPVLSESCQSPIRRRSRLLP